MATPTPLLTLAAMRLAPLLYFCVAGILWAGEEAPTPTYPLWDGHESVADYAARVHLPPTKTLHLGSGVNLELVLIPAGKFTMGTPDAAPVDEAGFRAKIMRGQILLAVSAGAMLVLLAYVIIKAVRMRQRPRFSLLFLLVVTVLAGCCLLSCLHWRRVETEMRTAEREYVIMSARYLIACDVERQVHAVTISEPFYMGKYAVTQEQYQAVMGPHRNAFKGKDYPADMVSWESAQEFCSKLTKDSTSTIRLPTEAEWEYACRAGTVTTYYSGDTEADLARVAWYSECKKFGTNPVGKLEPNAFGLYDMHGNVEQWCDSDSTDATSMPTECPLRGGSWCKDATYCHSSFRMMHNSYSAGWDIGFRIVMSAF